MAFAVRNLSVLNYAAGFTLWHYRTSEDRLDAVGAANYLADAGDMLNVGDLMMIVAADGARIICVSVAEDGAVVTAPLT